MSFELNENTPIYMQLAEQIKIDIISGKLQSGERLLSVRELALQSKVNPNTMQKALAELEALELIYTERTNGKFVTQDSQKISSFRKEYALEMSRRFFSDMQKIGFDKEQTKMFIDSLGGDA